MLENWKQNRQALLSSAIVAKAALKRENGRINLIVVFQQSTKHEFYWVFQAKSAKSARKSWKYVSVHQRDFNLAEKPYRDFGTFVTYFARNQRAEVLAMRVLHIRRLAILLAKTEHESIHTDWTPQNLSHTPNPADFRLVNARAARGRDSRGFYFNQRNRKLDEFTQTPNEVLVFADWCEECMSRHSYAHFADATKNKCNLDYFAMKRNPGFEYSGFQSSIRGYRFIYRSVIGAGA